MNNPFPIEHVVIIIKENHTFDNYFGTFPGANGIALPQAPDVLPSDLPHDHKSWLNRKNIAVKKQYKENDIPRYFTYAKNFTLCDNFFSDVAGPSTPNHLMLVTADSPIIDNLSIFNFFNPLPPYNLSSLPQQLEDKGLEWKNYGDLVFRLIRHTILDRRNVHSSQLVSDIASNALPAVSWVVAPTGSTEHPPESVSDGEAWTVEQLNAVMNTSLWNNTAIFVVWDDWGGWFDHVDEPVIELFKDGTQFRYGSRVPCLVISPYAKKGHISKNFLSFVSILKFCELIFGLSSLNNRTAQAGDMTNCFDFSQTPLPPLIL